ncbi:ATP-binding protein [Intestinibaculum porci]|uniref:ATP-binding protein n=1 Tax=Intestinibaculum porci TaxID=2487118 RepID=A0A3G9J535_9FIRM|nr:DUF87 domain-containing protein [Intestinibaculum porci]BBH26297.1 ATP-binding protein [Intestinibaculum porci]
MAKEDIDVRSRNDLDDALAMVDQMVMHKYISTIDKRPIFVPTYNVGFSMPKERSDDLPLLIVGDNIMLSKLKKVVYDDDEDILDKLTSAYNATALYESATLVMILKSNGSQIEVYYGTVCKTTKDNFVPQQQLEALKRNVEANFPGSELEIIDTLEEREEIVQDIFEDDMCISAVSGIAALKNQEKNGNKSYIQGLEKLTDSLKGKKCTVLVIADPVNDLIRESIRSGYEEIYSALKPFEKSEYSVNSTNSKTVTNSVIKGVTDSVNQSVSKTNTHTLTKGTNSSYTVGGSKGEAFTKAVSAAFNVGIKFFGASLGGSFASSAISSIDAHFTHGRHKDVGESEGKTDTTGKSKALSEQNSIANALGSSQGEGLQITYENRSIKAILERIDLQIKRIDECSDFGMYDCGAYFLSKDYGTCVSVASTYKSLIQGEHSSVEAAHISLWNEEQAKYLRPYLSTFNHPIFNLADQENEEIPASVSTLVSGKELPIYMGIPKKSISGIPVIECASFGRNVLYSGKSDHRNEIDFGCIHHMHVDEDTRVILDQDSFTSHVFVTGSTGAGKSNAIYQLLKKTCLQLGDDIENTHFMVIEPAKGEYKDVFGGYDDVAVYGTNPLRGKLLKINPFSFPKDIHVLEHIDRLIEIFNVCWPMYAAMPAVLKEAIERAYKSVGWDLNRSECRYSYHGKALYPNFLDVLKQVNEVIVHSQYSADSKGDYIGALSMRLSSLTNGINGQILTNDEITMEELFDHNVIIDLSRVGSTETKSLLMGLMIIKLQEYRMSSATGTNKKLSHITVLEEAHNLLRKTSIDQSEETANLAGKSVEMLANAIAEMRTYGEGFVIADQSPGLMDMSVIRNTNTKIIFRLPDATDRDLVGKAASCNDKQIVELAKLQTGVCAVYQNNWIEPVLCHVDLWDEKWNKRYKPNPSPIPDASKTKNKVVRFALLPVGSIRKEAADKILADIDHAMLSTELKVNLLKFAKEKDVEKGRKLRMSIMHEIFAPDTALEKNIGYRNDAREWITAMKDTLEPQLDDFNEEETLKILSLLALGKDLYAGQEEYVELLRNLVTLNEEMRGSSCLKR